VTVLTDEGLKSQTFESRQAAFRTRERLERFLDGELAFGELEGLVRPQMDWVRRAAWELSESGDLEAAQRVLLALVLLDHRNPDVILQLAAVTEDLGQGSEALAFYSRALALAPQRIEALVARGELLLELGRLEDAVVDLVQAVELDPQDANLAAARARLLLQGVLKAAGLRLGALERPGAVEDDAPEAER
jgi:tetratricopeptide (TPR) repeat protein